MKYAMLIYGDDSTWVDLPDEEKATLRAEEMPQWISLFEELSKADPNVSGHELDGRGTARGATSSARFVAAAVAAAGLLGGLDPSSAGSLGRLGASSAG